MSSLMSRLLRKTKPSQPIRRLKRKPRARRLEMEILEDRIAPSTFTVTSNADHPDAGFVTLRDAINAVNSESPPPADYGNPHVIKFNITDPTINLEADLPALTNYWVLIDGSNDGGADVTVNGAGHAMLPFNSGTILDHVTFTGGTASLGADGYIEIRAGATLSVTGNLPVGDGAVIENYGTLAVSVDLDLADGTELYNGYYVADHATLTVGGNLDGGSGVLVYNAGASSSLAVTGHFDMGDGSGLYNGFNLTDAATLTVGGYFSTNDFVGNIGSSTINVAGNFTINTDSGGFGGNLENGNGFFAGGDVTLIVGGDFSAGGDVNNWGTSTLSITGDCTFGADLLNGYTVTDAATFTVGGNFSGTGVGSVTQLGASVLRVDGNVHLDNFAGAYNYDSSTLLVQGDFTIIGAGLEVDNGYYATDAAIFTVGGNFSMEADSYVYTNGTNPLTVTGSFTLGDNSYFEDFGSMVARGFFDPGTGDPGNNNTIGGTFTAAPGSNVTTNLSTWEVLDDGVLEVQDRGRFTLASGGSLIVDPGGTLAVDQGGTFTQGGSAQYNDDHSVNWTWTGHGGDGNWDNAANWDAVPSPNWIGGPTNDFPGQGAIAGEIDSVTIDTGATAATITVRAPDNLSVQTLYTAAGDTLAITGGTLTVLGSSKLRGSLAMTGGTLAVQGNKTSVKVTGATTVTGASLSATGGATLSLPNLSSYTNESASNPTTFTADGAGSLLDLPALATLGPLDSTLTIHALAGGDVNLSALTLDGADPNIIQDVSGGNISTQGTVNVASRLTIKEGTHTGTTYNLLPGAKLVIMGGSYGASFNVAAGATLTIHGGSFSGVTFNLAPGASVAIFGGTFTGTTTWDVGLGATVVVGGFVTASGTWTGTGLGTVELNAWRLIVGNGGLNLNFAGDLLQWSDGVIDGGLGDLTNLGTIHLIGSADKGLYNDGTFDNFGTIIQTGSGDFVLGTDNLFPSILKNELGALYQIEGDGGMDQVQDHYGAAFFPSIENAGTIRKMSGAGVSTFHLDGSITNTGTIEAASGTLKLNVGSLAQVSGGTLTGGIWKALNGATLQFPIATSITTNAATIALGGAGAGMTGLSWSTSTASPLQILLEHKSLLSCQLRLDLGWPLDRANPQIV